MTGYAANSSMATLLRAMKTEALQDTTQLKYLRDVRITSRGYWEPYSSPVLYLQPLGTLEERVAEYGAVSVIVPKHIIRVECVIHSGARQDSEVALIGSSAEIGLIPFVEDVLSYYENNWLSLSGITGIDPGFAPMIEPEEDTYTQLSDDNETVFFNVARLRYEAVMKAIERPTDT